MRRNARAWLGFFEQDEEIFVDDDGYDSEDFGEIQEDYESVGGQPAHAGGARIAIVRPHNFRDAVTIGRYFRQQIPVIINLEDMDNADAWRIVDFASGLTLGLYGDIERISKRTFLIMPADSTIHNAQPG